MNFYIYFDGFLYRFVKFYLFWKRDALSADLLPEITHNVQVGLVLSQEPETPFLFPHLLLGPRNLGHRVLFF